MELSFSFDDPVLAKLKNQLGEDRARSLIGEIFGELGVSALSSPDDHYQFGHALAQRGGLFEMIGRSIKVRALLHGAKATAP